jgi:hypothetical protein
MLVYNCTVYVKNGTPKVFSQAGHHAMSKPCFLHGLKLTLSGVCTYYAVLGYVYCLACLSTQHLASNIFGASSLRWEYFVW